MNIEQYGKSREGAAMTMKKVQQGLTVFLEQQDMEKVLEMANEQRCPVTELAGEMLLIGLRYKKDEKIKTSRLGSLSPREWDVVELLHQGLTTSEIADRLYISPNTAKTHVRNIMRKTKISARGEFQKLPIPEMIG